MIASRSAMRTVVMGALALTLGRALHAQQLRGVVRDSARDGLVQHCQLRRCDEVVLSFRAHRVGETSRVVTLSRPVNVVTVEMKPRR